MAHRQLLALFFSSLIALQSWAVVAVPCSMPMDNGNAVADVMDSHAGHNMMATVEDSTPTDSPDMQCCEEGYCSQSGCVVMSILLAGTGITSVPQYTTSSPAPGANIPDWSPDSLFRPPTL